ncbi:MAG TPA: asparagine synthase (glutamine-hydrolyzing) [Terriglobales bacterium]
MIGGPGEQVSGAEVRRMCSTIVHRGPDDEGVYARGPAGLGMRRLSIIDLSGGRQPIHNEDQSVWVVFNGEIYNFPELRKELEQRGHKFYTHSDTEVIVHLYEDFGADCVKKLRGMFAIALFDEKRQLLLLARDRLGKKPLYYAEKNGRLYFGSEIKTILAVAPSLSADINRRALLQFFSLQYIPDPNSAFRDIHKLPPGYLLEYKDGKVKTQQYWDVPAYGTNRIESEQECLDELERQMAEAVRIRLISDVPLGALLSGGVDSSVVVALMSRASSKPVKTFSIGFANQDFNEAPFARAVAEKFGTEHHEFVVEPNVSDTLSHLTGMMEEPFGDSSMIPTYHVSRIARQHVTVALSGEGGDELFAGYDRYPVHLDRMQYERVPSWMGSAFRAFVYPMLGPSFKGRRFLFNASLHGGDRYLDTVGFLTTDRERNLFSRDFLATANGIDVLAEVRSFYAKAQGPDRISRLLYLDTKSYLTGDVLTKVDRMSMATSLEVRCPILDHVLIEWVTGLPAKWKYRDGIRKYLLRKLAQRLGVPGLDRPKQGFAMPLTHWWKSDLRDTLLPILTEPKTLQRGYLNPTAVKQLVEEHLTGRRDYGQELWLLLVFELWQRNFLEKVAAGQARSQAEYATC